MAEVYQRAQAELTTALATIYTCPGATSAVVIGMRFTNIDGTSSVNVEAKVGASGSTKYVLAPSTTLPIGSSLSGLSGDKLIMEAGEIFEAKASANGDADIMLSVLEIS
jgi:hypothetical protein